MKKMSSWLVGGIAISIALGTVLVSVALLKPGQIAEPESAVGVGKPMLAEAKKRLEAVGQQQGQLADLGKQVGGLQGIEGEHRVFVSAQLVYLPDSQEPVQPLDRKMKTDDGIEVGWKMKYSFDPADLGVKDADPDGDGFTNLEEFLAQTDPTNKGDSPAKESKLKSRSGDPVAMTVSFPEKSGGLYTIRFQVGTKRREFKGRPKDAFWVMAGPEGLEVLQDDAKMRAAREKAKAAGHNSHVIPVKISSYLEKVEKVKDAKTGGIEVEVDNSLIVLERADAAPGEHNLVFSTPQRPQALSWDVGDIRLFTPAGGGTELGPFRVGQIFDFEGKKFSVVGRDGKKIQLRNLTDADKQPFWVPLETPAMLLSP